MFDSDKYWERRYQTGRNSGSGSYGRLAQFKADFLNRLVVGANVSSIIDFGCGDGNQLSLMDPVPYIGVDVSQTVLEAMRVRFEGQPLYKFIHRDELGAEIRSDLTISMDVIYHLVEDIVFDAYMNRLFHHARRIVVIYSSNYEAPYAGSHIRHRRFTDFVARNFPAWQQVAHTPNPYPRETANKDQTSFSDFYVFANPKPSAAI
jgi:SAM-dependent methyltransferase